MSDQQQKSRYDPQLQGERRVKFAFTPEEKAIVKECQSESLYYSCIPISFVCGFGASYLRHLKIIKKGYVGIGVAVFTGFIAGKFAYLPTCRKKFAERIPNSPYSQLITGKISQEEYMKIKENEYQTERASGYQQQYNNRQPEIDVFNDNDVENDELKQSVTYEELRRKHRGQLSAPQPAMPKPKFDVQRTEEDDWSKSRMPDIDNNPKGQGKRNKYGDLLD